MRWIKMKEQIFVIGMLALAVILMGYALTKKTTITYYLPVHKEPRIGQMTLTDNEMGEVRYQVTTIPAVPGKEVARTTVMVREHED
jgi:glucose uptake protein GlcU